MMVRFTETCSSDDTYRRVTFDNDTSFVFIIMLHDGKNQDKISVYSAPRVKRPWRQPGHSPPRHVKFKNGSLYTGSFPHFLQASWLTKPKYNLTFTLRCRVKWWLCFRKGLCSRYIYGTLPVVIRNWLVQIGCYSQTHCHSTTSSCVCVTCATCHSIVSKVDVTHRHSNRVFPVSGLNDALSYCLSLQFAVLKKNSSAESFFSQNLPRPLLALVIF